MILTSWFCSLLSCACSYTVTPTGYIPSKITAELAFLECTLGTYPFHPGDKVLGMCYTERLFGSQTNAASSIFRRGRHQMECVTKHLLLDELWRTKCSQHFVSLFPSIAWGSSAQPRRCGRLRHPHQGNYWSPSSLQSAKPAFKFRSR